MEKYPQYNLNHFFRFRFIEGGLTLSQVIGLYENHCKRIYEERKFLAAIHGIDLNKSAEEAGKSEADKIEQKQGLSIFRDPAEYEKMTDEEKEEMTQKMLSQHRRWVDSMGKKAGS
jgi:hypothetical protein